MDIKEVLVSLRRQEENLNLLLNAVTAKQRAIVEGKIAKLEEVIFEEENLFKNIELLEKQRIDSIEKFSTRLGLEIKYKNLNEFMKYLRPRLDKKFYEEVMKVRANVIELVKKINNINEQNKVLITHSISFIKSTITSLIDSKRNSLIDRRI
jgi:FlgN protein.